MGFYCFDIFGYKKRGFCATLLSSYQVFIFLKPVFSFFPESRLFSFQSVCLSCFTPPLSLILSVTQPWSRVSKPSRARGRVGLYGFIFVQAFTMKCFHLHGHLVYIKYTWCIGNCATWCYIPAPSSCRSLLAFNL